MPTTAVQAIDGVHRVGPGSAWPERAFLVKLSQEWHSVSQTLRPEFWTVQETNRLGLSAMRSATGPARQRSTLSWPIQRHIVLPIWRIRDQTPSAAQVDARQDPLLASNIELGKSLRFMMRPNSSSPRRCRRSAPTHHG